MVAGFGKAGKEEKKESKLNNAFQQPAFTVRFSKPINTQPYIEKFLDDSDPEGPKKAVKALTQEIRNQMLNMTINAPDW